jgi:hypothetical protein
MLEEVFIAFPTGFLLSIAIAKESGQTAMCNPGSSRGHIQNRSCQQKHALRAGYFPLIITYLTKLNEMREGLSNFLDLCTGYSRKQHLEHPKR